MELSQTSGLLSQEIAIEILFKVDKVKDGVN